MNKIILLLLLCSILSGGFLSCSYTPEKNLNPHFEQQLVKTLGLKLVSRDSMYYTAYERIFNDTIVGYHDNHVRNPKDSCYYFFQSLNNPQYIRRVFESCETNPTFIDDFRDGCMYFGKFGGSSMVSVGTDSLQKLYFKKYSTQLFYANKVLLYKNKAVVSSYNGIYVFDLKTEQLLWKCNWDLDRCHNEIVGNMLIFKYNIQKSNGEKDAQLHTFLCCVDLDRFEYLWKRRFENDLSSASKADGDNYGINHNDKYISMMGDSLYVINIKTGTNAWVKPVKQQYAYFNGDTLYVNSIQEDQNTPAKFSGDLTSYTSNFTANWKVKDVFYDCTIHGKVVAYSTDHNSCIIIDGKTGRTISSITVPTHFSGVLAKMDKYMLVGDVSLYK